MLEESGQERNLVRPERFELEAICGRKRSGSPQPKFRAVCARDRKAMVRPERFELPTYCSGGNRSIHLSYGRIPYCQSTRPRETASTSPGIRQTNPPHKNKKSRLGAIRPERARLIRFATSKSIFVGKKLNWALSNSDRAGHHRREVHPGLRHGLGRPRRLHRRCARSSVVPHSR
jgi:hypothetical protein